MPARVQVVAGPACSGKTSALIEQYAQALKALPIGGALWLSPTQRAAAEVRGKLAAASGGCFSPAVHTFAQFAEMLLDAAGQPVRFIGGLVKRQLIEQLLSEQLAAGQLAYFAPIAHTGGLVDLVTGLVADLKRQEIWPDDFDKAIEPLKSPKSRELATLYRGYQDLLTQHRLYDAEGRFWSARQLLKEQLHQPQWGGQFAALKFVVVDGFADFTITQHEILQLLAARVDEMFVSLPLEQSSERGDLFLKPRHTLDQLEAGHASLQVAWTERPATAAWPALDHAERHLFANPRTLKPVEDAARIEIIAASGALAEIQTIARRIKQLLLVGDEVSRGPVPAADIAVVFRSLGPNASLVREVFAEYGLPVAIEAGATLNNSPVLLALASIVRLVADDWPFRGLLAVLGNNYVRPAWPQWNETVAATVEWAIRQMQVPAGSEALLNGLEGRAKFLETQLTDTGDEPPEEADIAQRQEHIARYRTAAELLRQLQTVLKKLHKPRTLHQWQAAVNDLGRELGLLAVAEESELQAAANSPAKFDKDAWKQLLGAMAAGVQLDAWLDRQPQPLDLRKFLAYLEELLAQEQLPSERDDTGRVRVLSAGSVRALSVPYLFVAGLTEKSFPSPARDGIYSPAECEQLNQRGLRFIDAAFRAGDEMLLFYETITRATRRLTLSYPSLDEKAQPLLPSPYLLELQRALGVDRVQRTVDVSLSPVPQHEVPMSRAEARLKATAELLQGEPRRFQALLHAGSAMGNSASEFPPLISGLTAVAARAKFDGFSSMEGIFSSEAAKKLLADRFGPQHCWSVSRLEAYAHCGFQFLAARILRLEPLPELSLGTDYGQRGSIAHETLAHLHRRMNDGGRQQSPADCGAETFGRLQEETFTAVFDSLPPGGAIDMALRDVDFEMVKKWLQGYFAQHEKYDGAWQDLPQPLRPAHFEVSFGMKRRRRGEVVDGELSRDEPFVVRHEGEEIQLAGRIDRIDIGMVGGQVVFNVLDYKTGKKRKVTEQELHAGLALQLPLYSLAVQELLMVDRRAVPWRIGYWYVKDAGFSDAGWPPLFDATDDGVSETPAWQALRGTLLARVVALVRGIRGGQFPVYSTDDNCTSFCEYNTICRIGQVRSLKKVWGAAGVKSDDPTEENGEE